MSDRSDQSRMSPADRWAEQQMRDRQNLELAAFVAWQAYAYETGTDADRRALRIVWGSLPSVLFLWGIWSMVSNPGDPTNWSAMNFALLGVCGLLGYALVFTKPTPRDPAPVPFERQRYLNDEPFDNNWQEFYGK